MNEDGLIPPPTLLYELPTNPAAVGVELVSRTYSARDARWPAELATVFKALQHGSLALAAAASAAAAACCSTHVHVSRAPPLAPAELAALAKAALLYEPALDRLVPPHRRGGRAGRDGNDDGDGDGGCYWIRSNRASTALRRLRLGECLGRIDAAAAAAAGGEGGQGTGTHGTLSAVVEVMNLFPADSPAGRAVRAPADFVHGKVFKWNFAGVAGRLGTVEFRQPPGSLGGDDAVGWVALAAAFVAGALALGPGLGGDSCSAREQGASLAELRALLRLGADALGWPGLGVVDAWLERAEREAET